MIHKKTKSRGETRPGRFSVSFWFIQFRSASFLKMDRGSSSTGQITLLYLKAHIAKCIAFPRQGAPCCGAQGLDLMRRRTSRPLDVVMWDWLSRPRMGLAKRPARCCLYSRVVPQRQEKRGGSEQILKVITHDMALPVSHHLVSDHLGPQVSVPDVGWAPRVKAWPMES